LSRSREQGRTYISDLDDFGSGGRRRRVTVGRVALNIAVLAAFGIAVYAMYTLVQNSGVLGRSAEEVTVKSMFVDIPDTHPQLEELQDAAILGLVETSAPDRYGVREPVTRGDLATVAIKTVGLRVPVDGVQSFADVQGDPEMLDESDYVALAVEQGYMSGFGGDPPLFDVDADSSVGEVMIVFARVGGDALTDAAAGEVTPTDTTAVEGAVEASTTTTAAEASPEGTGEAAAAPEAVPLDAQSAYARLDEAGILDGLDVYSTEEALGLGARRELVAVIAVRMRELLDAL
jgi:hypothetical protein